MRTYRLIQIHIDVTCLLLVQPVYLMVGATNEIGASGWLVRSLAFRPWNFAVVAGRFCKDKNKYETQLRKPCLPAPSSSVVFITYSTWTTCLLHVLC
jgi:hypothetical protein